MINNIDILKMARELGSTKTLTDVNNYIAEIDRTPLETVERAKYTVEIWDKVTPINGISPEKILEDTPNGSNVYLIYINGRLTYLQKHNPFEMGLRPMETPEEAVQCANQFIDMKVEEAVDNIVINQVLEKMLS